MAYQLSRVRADEAKKGSQSQQVRHARTTAPHAKQSSRAKPILAVTCEVVEPDVVLKSGKKIVVH